MNKRAIVLLAALVVVANPAVVEGGRRAVTASPPGGGAATSKVPDLNKMSPEDLRAVPLDQLLGLGLGDGLGHGEGQYGKPETSHQFVPPVPAQSKGRRIGAGDVIVSVRESTNVLGGRVYVVQHCPAPERQEARMSRDRPVLKSGPSTVGTDIRKQQQAWDADNRRLQREAGVVNGYNDLARALDMELGRWLREARLSYPDISHIRMDVIFGGAPAPTDSTFTDVSNTSLENGNVSVGAMKGLTGLHSAQAQCAYYPKYMGVNFWRGMRDVSADDIMAAMRRGSAVAMAYPYLFKQCMSQFEYSNPDHSPGARFAILELCTHRLHLAVLRDIDAKLAPLAHGRLDPCTMMQEQLGSTMPIYSLETDPDQQAPQKVNTYGFEKAEVALVMTPSMLARLSDTRLELRLGQDVIQNQQQLVNAVTEGVMRMAGVDANYAQLYATIEGNITLIASGNEPRLMGLIANAVGNVTPFTTIGAVARAIAHVLAENVAAVRDAVANRYDHSSSTWERKDGHVSLLDDLAACLIYDLSGARTARLNNLTTEGFAAQLRLRGEYQRSGGHAHYTDPVRILLDAKSSPLSPRERQWLVENANAILEICGDEFGREPLTTMIVDLCTAIDPEVEPEIERAARQALAYCVRIMRAYELGIHPTAAAALRGLVIKAAPDVQEGLGKRVGGIMDVFKAAVPNQISPEAAERLSIDVQAAFFAGPNVHQVLPLSTINPLRWDLWTIEYLMRLISNEARQDIQITRAMNSVTGGPPQEQLILIHAALAGAHMQVTSGTLIPTEAERANHGARENAAAALQRPITLEGLRTAERAVENGLQMTPGTIRNKLQATEGTAAIELYFQLAEFVAKYIKGMRNPSAFPRLAPPVAQNVHFMKVSQQDIEAGIMQMVMGMNLEGGGTPRSVLKEAQDRQQAAQQSKRQARLASPAPAGSSEGQATAGVGGEAAPGANGQADQSSPAPEQIDTEETSQAHEESDDTVEEGGPAAGAADSGKETAGPAAGVQLRGASRAVLQQPDEISAIGDESEYAKNVVSASKQAPMRLASLTLDLALDPRNPNPTRPVEWFMKMGGMIRAKESDSMDSLRQTTANALRRLTEYLDRLKPEDPNKQRVGNSVQTIQAAMAKDTVAVAKAMLMPLMQEEATGQAPQAEAPASSSLAGDPETDITPDDIGVYRGDDPETDITPDGIGVYRGSNQGQQAPASNSLEGDPETDITPDGIGVYGGNNQGQQAPASNSLAGDPGTDITPDDIGVYEDNDPETDITPDDIGVYEDNDPETDITPDEIGVYRGNNQG
ncbi:MAG: hypothetical protein LBJ69_02695 [Holosporales bacterium]|nr:hypothetical protein [Holosporales bacterium]